MTRMRSPVPGARRPCARTRPAGRAARGGWLAVLLLAAALGARAADAQSVARAPDAAAVRPSAQTPRFLVTGHRPQVDRNVAAADTVARTLQRRIRVDTLWVLAPRDVEVVIGSPYERGSDTVSDRDLIAIGRQTRAGFVLDVSAASDSAGVRLLADLFWTRAPALPAGSPTHDGVLPIATLEVAGPTVARAAETLVDRLVLDAGVLGLRRGPPR